VRRREQPDGVLARLRGVVRRHALLLVDGELQRAGEVVNVVAREVRPLVEVATAVALGAPALVKEGLSWREVRLRAMHTAPVELSALPRGGREAEAARG